MKSSHWALLMRVPPQGSRAGLTARIKAANSVSPAFLSCERLWLCCGCAPPPPPHLPVLDASMHVFSHSDWNIPYGV